ncbi:MAG: ribosomal-processing cysteine protease Prp [Lachnospiraceae bacterium]|nr:ribosomal-processing cysteine protease Prp [Lachnospiraceae bacterium]
MISITVFRSGHQYRGFVSKGHAGFAEEGYDIICAAVSVLTINTINSMEQFTDEKFTVEQGEDGGYLKLELSGLLSEKAELLMNSLVLGLQTIEENYGSKYIRVHISDCQGDHPISRS